MYWVSQEYNISIAFELRFSFCKGSPCWFLRKWNAILSARLVVCNCIIDVVLFCCGTLIDRHLICLRQHYKCVTLPHHSMDTYHGYCVVKALGVPLASIINVKVIYCTVEVIQWTLMGGIILQYASLILLLVMCLCVCMQGSRLCCAHSTWECTAFVHVRAGRHMLAHYISLISHLVTHTHAQTDRHTYFLYDFL